MDITGMSEEEYRWFVRECYKNSKLRPGEPVALGPLGIALINLAVSLLLSAAAMLLAQSLKTKRHKHLKKKRLRVRTSSGVTASHPSLVSTASKTLSTWAASSPSSIANATKRLASPYGGIRVNTNLLWSQVLSVGGGQFFRGIFLVGEAPINLERRQLALGNNTLASYELDVRRSGRISYYLKMRAH